MAAHAWMAWTATSVTVPWGLPALRARPILTSVFRRPVKMAPSVLTSRESLRVSVRPVSPTLDVLSTLTTVQRLLSWTKRLCVTMEARAVTVWQVLSVTVQPVTQARRVRRKLTSVLLLPVSMATAPTCLMGSIAYVHQGLRALPVPTTLMSVCRHHVPLGQLVSTKSTWVPRACVRVDARVLRAT